MTRLAIACGLLGLILSGLTGCGGGSEIADEPIAIVPAADLKQTDVLPTSAGKLDPQRNYVYCASFQIAWGELRELIGKEPVRLRGGSEFATSLNEHPYKRAHLDAAGYVALAGRTDRGIEAHIRETMAKRFPQASLTMPQLPPKVGVCVFAYLAETLAFDKEFEPTPKPLTFRSGGTPVEVAAFGVDEHSTAWHPLMRQVTLFDYRGPDDFIIRLHTKNADEQLILAKVAPQATLAETMVLVDQRIAAERAKSADDQRRVNLLDAKASLEVPLVRVGVDRTYDELAGKTFENFAFKGLGIIEAQQAIKFQLDRRGAKVESISITTMTKSEVGSEPPRRDMIFDKPFLITMSQGPKSAPYFAIWVANEEVLEKK